MPVVGLVVNLASDSRDAERALLQMQDADCLTLGPPPVPGRVPVVLEAETETESRQHLRWLSALPGVAQVQVVSADFSDLTPPAPGSPEAVLGKPLDANLHHQGAH